MYINMWIYIHLNYKYVSQILVPSSFRDNFASVNYQTKIQKMEIIISIDINRWVNGFKKNILIKRWNIWEAYSKVIDVATTEKMF